MSLRTMLFVVCLLAGLPAWGRDGAPASAAADAAPLIFLGNRNLAPYEFESGGEPRGSNVDIAQAIGRVMGRPVEVRLDEWSQAQKRFRQGEGHVLMPLGRSSERDEWLAYTHPVVSLSFALFVRTDDTPPVDPRRLAGVRIAAVAGGLVRQLLAQQQPEAVLLPVDTLEIGTRRLLAREVDALAAPAAPQLYLMQQRDLRGVTQLEPFHIERLGFGVRRDEHVLLAALDEAIASLERSGELERIGDRWTSERVFLFSGFTVRMGQYAAAIALLALVALGVATMLLFRQRKRLRVEIAERREAEAVALLSEERTARLQRMTAALTATVTPDDVAWVVAQNHHEAVTAPFVWVAELVDRGRTWQTLAMEGADADALEGYRRFSVHADLPIREALLRRAPVVFSSREEGIAMNPAWRDLLEAVSIEAQYVTALTSGRDHQDVVGALAFGWPEPREFDALRLEQLASVSALVAQALERTQLRRSELRTAQRQSVLKDVAAALNGAPGVTEICAIVCEAGMQALSATYGVVASIDEAGVHVEGSAATRAPLRMAHLTSGAEEGFQRWRLDPRVLLARVLEERRSIFADEPAALVELHGPPPGSGPDDAPCAVAALPLIAPEEDTAPLGVLAFYFARECDLSDEVQAFIVSLADLASRAIDRSRLLDQLRASLAASSAADQRKDEFLAMLGHELRNPLSPIVSAVELLARAGDRAAVREQTVDVIRRQVRQMIRLVDDLLELSRVRHGLIELQVERVDLVSVAREALETVRAQAEQKQHTLVERWPQEPLHVEADGGRVQQIVINLLTNAVRYTPEGGRVEISAADHGDWVLLEVRDNGVGIEPEFLPRVFELFTQGGTRRSGSGLGLGLALVKQLAQLHGGSIEARSEGSGRGASFVLRLPSRRG